MSEQSSNVDEPEQEGAEGGAVDGGNPPVDGPPADDDGAEGDTFPRAVVEKLRRENAGYRTRAQRADELGQRLHTELVRATGRLADPDDLTFNPAHLDSAEALTAAIDALVERKPHLAARRPAGDIGQGATGGRGGVDLAGLLRGAAG